MEKDASFRFEFLPPSQGLSDRINTLFLLEAHVDSLEEILPAYSAQVLVFARGAAEISYAVGGGARIEGAGINAPMLESAAVRLEGRVLIAGISLTPLGWASLTGRPVDRCHDTFLPAEAFLPPGYATKLADIGPRLASGKIDGASACRELEALVESASLPVKAEHARLISATMDWLSSAFSPPREDLLARLPYEERQVQRLCKRFFGAPPATLLKRFRAIRAAALLAQDDLSEAMRDEIHLAYFDQAHLIRDIRRYTGRTPKWLKHPSLVTDTLDPDGHGPAAEILRAGLERAR